MQNSFLPDSSLVMVHANITVLISTSWKDTFYMYLSKVTCYAK